MHATMLQLALWRILIVTGVGFVKALPPAPPTPPIFNPNPLSVYQLTPYDFPSAGSGEGGKAVLYIQGLWHPCAVSRVAGDAVVPNDLVLGSQQQNG